MPECYGSYGCSDDCFGCAFEDECARETEEGEGCCEYTGEPCLSNDCETCPMLR